jgi:hypothetical protein
MSARVSISVLTVFSMLSWGNELKAQGICSAMQSLKDGEVLYTCTHLQMPGRGLLPNSASLMSAYLSIVR